jgi:hypothetical protein
MAQPTVGEQQQCQCWQQEQLGGHGEQRMRCVNWGWFWGNVGVSDQLTE